MKKLFSLALSICMLCLLAIPTNANERLLEYEHIDTVTANLTLNRFWGVATCTGSVEASDDYPVYVEVALQQKTDNGWITLETWTNEGQIFANANGSYAIAKGYQYRTYTTGYVYDNGTIIDCASAIYAVTYD